jgi:hypothetical protein
MYVPKPIDIKSENVYGRLTVVEDLGGNPRKVLCRCSCGNVVEKWLCNLRNRSIHRGADTGCGCVRREATVKRNTTHGLTNIPEYGVWCGMRKRCLNSNCKSYHDYGGRGIGICKRWSSFSNFYLDMGSRPTAQHSLDRKNPNGDYCKRNCRWSTKAEQNRNTRVTRRITIGKTTLCMSEWDRAVPGFRDALYRKGESSAHALAVRCLRLKESSVHINSGVGNA